MATSLLQQSELTRASNLVSENSPRTQNQVPDEEDIEIRQIPEPAPQRRGVEINLNRFVQPRRQPNNENSRPQPRRIRLSVPLGVMAAESLKLQRKSNSLLADILLTLRADRRN